jgi:cytochrome c oxidase subunit II
LILGLFEAGPCGDKGFATVPTSVVGPAQNQADRTAKNVLFKAMSCRSLFLWIQSMSRSSSRKSSGSGLRRSASGGVRFLDGSARPAAKRWMNGLAGLGLALFLSGCSFTTKQSTLDPKGLVAREELHLFYITVWVSLFIFLTVGSTMVYAMWRYRERPEDVGKPMPHQEHGNPLIEISLITASIALLVIIAIPTLKDIMLTEDMPTDQPYWQPSLLGNWYPGGAPELAADEPLTITVHGYQWWWGFEYPQFGITSSNEFLIPAGKVVRFNLRSDNVIHSFWLPKLAGKIDLMPGRSNWIWMMADPDAFGLYYGQCAQYCGESHAFMLFRCRVVSDQEFAQWVKDSQRKVPAPGAGGDWPKFIKAAVVNKDPVVLATAQARGAALFFGRANCVQCHTIDGTTAQGTIGPNLSRVATRTSIAAGWFDNLNNDGTAIDPERQRQNFFKWISDSKDVKPGNFMWYGNHDQGGGLASIVATNRKNGTPITDADFNDIVAFLQTLK